jgi:hypothetical protein
MKSSLGSVLLGGLFILGSSAAVAAPAVDSPPPLPAPALPSAAPPAPVPSPLPEAVVPPPPAVAAAPVVALPTSPPAEAPYAEYERCLNFQRAGNGPAAHECYQRFLPTALRAGSVAESAIPSLVSQLARFPEPAIVYPTVRREGKQRNAGLWGAGLAMLLTGMVPPLVFGPLYADQASSNRKTIYYTLMIPVVGPFISGTWLPLASKSHDDIIQYTVPWVVADGVTQLAGLIMFIAGVQSRPLPPQLARLLGNVSVLPYASGQSAGLGGTF